MQMSQMHYLPRARGFFAILVGFFLIVLIVRSVRYAYDRGVVVLRSLTRVEIGPIRIGWAGNRLIRSPGSGSSLSQRV